MSVSIAESDGKFIITHALLEQALAQISVGFWEVDLAPGLTMVCTGKCKENFGWDPGQKFTYLDMLSCILEEDRVDMQQKVATAIESGKPYFAQYRVKHSNNEIHWIEARGTVYYTGGIAQKIVGTTIDISEKKDLELLRDELFSVSMHEIKTPLSSVKAALQIVERYVEKDEEPRIAGFVSRALGSMDRIERLLEEMSDSIVSQSGEIVLNKSYFDLGALMQEIADNALLINPKVNINIHPKDLPVYVMADRYRISQVFSNLINNSIKYTDRHAAITVNLNRNDDSIIVQVKDNGQGIVPAEQELIFQKFHRSSNATNKEGLGIGLFLCSEIILRHGGKIFVQQSDDSGSTICFTLPSAAIGMANPYK